MSITDPLEDELSSLGTSFAVQIVAEQAAAQRTLERLASALRDLDMVVSPAISLSQGALIRVDGAGEDPSSRERVANLIRGELDDTDLDGDSLLLHAVDGLADLDTCPQAVVLRLFTPPSRRGRPLPPTWIDVAADWVFGDLPPDAVVRLRVLGAERRVRVADAAGVLHTCAAGGAWCDVVSGDVTDRIRTASISFGTAPHLAIAAGGPGCDDAGLVARFELLADVAVELADWASYAAIDFEEAFDQLALGLATSAWSAAGHAPANRVVGEHGDRAIPDVYPFQLLGPGHRERLTLAGAEIARAGISWTDTGDGHGILRLSTPKAWLTESGRADAQRDGWDALAALLLDADDLGERPEAVTPSTRPAGGLPDLRDIVIEPGPHARRGTHLSPLELAAWLAGEPHTDRPTSVAPVLAALLRGLARGLPAGKLQAIGDIVPLAVGSATVERDRERDVVEWLVRVLAATWLRHAGVAGLSERLGDLDGVVSHTGARRAVALLSDALVTAQRRLDITTAIAGEHAPLVEACAWAAWEAAADACGWSATSDAVTVGAPAELAAEIDRRLVDSSRDRASGNADVGASDVWASAHGEFGAFAWRRAWERAERSVRADSAFSVRTTIHASLDAILADGAIDADQAADAVDAAAGDALAAAISSGTATTDPFELGQEADEGEAGQAWRLAIGSARHVIGERDFDDALEAARGELEHWFGVGPRLVMNLTVTALAREAAGVAARAIAARAAAECAATGGSDVECAAEADASLAPVVDELADAVLALAAQLCEPDSASTA